MITANELTVEVPFETDPVWCDITSSYTGTDTGLISYNSATMIATIQNSVDLSYSGPIASPYEREITVDFAASSDTLSTTEFFTILVKNPCANNVQINTPDDLTEVYQVNADTKIIDYTAGYSVGTSI